MATSIIVKLLQKSADFNFTEILGTHTFKKFQNETRIRVHTLFWTRFALSLRDKYDVWEKSNIKLRL